MALNDQMQQMVQQDIKDAETRPKDEILQEQMDGLKTAGRTVRDVAIESIPGVSEALAEKRVDEALKRGDTTGAMIEGAAGLMGAVPMVGDAAAKGLRAATKKFRNVSPLEIGASEAAQEGKFLKNYDKSIVDDMKKESRAATAGTKKADALIDAKVSDGTKVGIRLNLNSTIPNMPRGLDKLQTLHKNNYNGKALSYRSFATVEDVTFNVNQKGRQGIAAKVKGIDVPEAKNKFPAMSVDGKLNNTRNVLDEVDDEVVEIGFNPVTGHLFTDLATGQAVKGADVATVVGDRVYAKGVTYLKKADAPTPLDATDGTKLSSEVRYRFNKGGALPMNNMAKQMELFEPVERGFDEGGLMDEGGTVDPISGNDVPPGSTQEEVRDDIPAQLSEGEFVVPADVVRYIGLENLMRMRQEAKQGLAEMEAMGQMGNSEQAVMPDDLPFDEYDLEVEDDGLEMNTGGFVSPSPPNQVNPMTGVYQTGSTGITGFQNYQGQPTGFTPYGGSAPYFQPVQFTGPQYTTALQTTNLPTFADTVGSQAGQYDELKTYQNDAGQTLQIPFKNGQPIYPVPEGYIPIVDQPKPEEISTTVTPTLGQAQVRDDSGGRGDVTTPTTSTRSVSLSNSFGGPDYFASPGVMSISGRDLIGTAGQKNNMYGGSSKYGFSNEALRNSTFSLGKNQIASSSAIFGAAKAIGDRLDLDTNKISFNRHAIAGNTARADALNFLGLAGTNQLDYMNNDLAATVVGTAMEKAMAASKKGENPTEAFNDYMSSADAMQARNAVYDAIKDSFASDGVPSQMGVLGLGDYTNRDFANDLADLADDARTELESLGPEVMDSKPGKNSTTHHSYRSRDYNNLDADGNPTVGYQRNKRTRTTADYLNSTLNQVESLQSQAETKAVQDSASDFGSSKSAEDFGKAKDRVDAGTRSEDMDSNIGGDGGGQSADKGDAEGKSTEATDNDMAFKSGGLAKQMKRSGLASKK